MGVIQVYTDSKGIKRCRFLGKKYPEECHKCHHYVPIFCGCDYESYHGESIGSEIEGMKTVEDIKKEKPILLATSATAGIVIIYTVLLNIVNRQIITKEQSEHISIVLLFGVALFGLGILGFVAK